MFIWQQMKVYHCAINLKIIKTVCLSKAVFFLMFIYTKNELLLNLKCVCSTNNSLNGNKKRLIPPPPYWISLFFDKKVLRLLTAVWIRHSKCPWTNLYTVYNFRIVLMLIYEFGLKTSVRSSYSRRLQRDYDGNACRIVIAFSNWSRLLSFTSSFNILIAAHERENCLLWKRKYKYVIVTTKNNKLHCLCFSCSWVQ